MSEDNEGAIRRKIKELTARQDVATREGDHDLAKDFDKQIFKLAEALPGGTEAIVGGFSHETGNRTV